MKLEDVTFLFNGGKREDMGRRTKGKLHPGIACLFMVAHQFSATANNKKRNIGG